MLRIAALAIAFLAFPGMLLSQEPPNAQQISPKQETNRGADTEKKTETEQKSAAPATPAAPSVHPETASHKSANETTKGDEQGTEFWQPIYGYRLKITDTLLVFFTCLLFVATLLLWGATKRLVRRGDETAMRELRAYVGIIEVKFISHFNPQGKYYWWSVAPVWANTGQTPTRALFINVNSYIDAAPLPENWDFPPGASDYDTPLVLHPRGTLSSAEIHVTGTELAKVQEGKKNFYIWGWAKYNDIFDKTPERVTKFCYRVTFRGDPTKPISAKNVCEMIFSSYPKHNCADDDCKE